MLKKLVQNFSSLFGVLLLVVSLWAISNELRAYNYHDVLNGLAAIPFSRLVWGVGLTCLGYGAMTGYDTLAFGYIGRRLAYKKIAWTAFISCAVSNTIGFALLTGSAIRYRFYSAWRVPAIANAQIIAFTNFSFWLGLFTVGGLMFCLYPVVIPTKLNLPFLSVRPIGIIFLLAIAVYLLGSIFVSKSLTIGRHNFRFPSLQVAIAQIAISSLDWSLAAAVLYTLLPINTGLTYPSFLSVYLLAMTAGVVSNVPGGLGVFESVVLLLLSPQIPSAQVLSSLLAYRVVYYLLPLGVATGLLGIYELNQRFKARSF